ncbi:MAG: DUF1552 domain-containing protein [Planctomycetes bacterium]|nr:DUF1552 domain-containing protein [Planctomycetota bacterium]MCB9920172.1 DUF1552 domain-containing protein [Planctomycetota bacterium]
MALLRCCTTSCAVNCSASGEVRDVTKDTNAEFARGAAVPINTLDRRCFLRGTGIALALPAFTSLRLRPARRTTRKRFAAIYIPDGVPMPLAEDPAYEEWAWFPHGSGRDFRWTKCLEPLDPLREQLTVLSGLSHPAARNLHGHSNADQFLTGAATGASGPYHNSISLDQVFAAHVGDETRFASLVMSTDGGTGTPRGAHTVSFDRRGRAIPAEHRPKRVFDTLFVKSDAHAERRLALAESALDDLLEDARALQRELSSEDRESFEEYLHSVREAEIRVQKAKRWSSIPRPNVDVSSIDLEVTPEDSRAYLRAMFELIYLAFRTDTTRVAAYMIGRENGVGISDYLARAVGFKLTHQLSHDTTKPGGWKNFGTYHRYLSSEYGRFLQKLKDTPEPDGEGTMLDNTLLLYGSASSAFHLSRNYPLILAGGKRMGLEHGRYLNFIGDKAAGGPWSGGPEPWMKEAEHEDIPLGKLYVSMLRRLGMQVDSFAGIDGGLPGV